MTIFIKKDLQKWVLVQIRPNFDLNWTIFDINRSNFRYKCLDLNRRDDFDGFQQQIRIKKSIKSRAGYKERHLSSLFEFINKFFGWCTKLANLKLNSDCKLEEKQCLRRLFFASHKKKCFKSFFLVFCWDQCFHMNVLS